MANFQFVEPVKLAQAAIGITTSTIYTVPASTRTYVKDIDICNTNASGVLNVTVYLVPSGGTAGTGNMIIPSLQVVKMFQWSGTQVMNAGDTIQVVASATGATINVSGGEAV